MAVALRPAGECWLRPFVLAGVAMMYTLLSCSLSQRAVRLSFALGLLGLRPAGECLLRPFALAGAAMMYTLLSCSLSQLAVRLSFALGLLGLRPGGLLATAVRACRRCHDVYAGIFLFISASPCAGRHFISFSNGEKETEAKKTPTNVTPEVSPACSSGVSGTYVARHVVNHAWLNPFATACLAHTLRPHGPTYSR